MTALAKVVKVDEAWLALGKAPAMPEVKSEKQVRGVEGVIYHLAGIVGLNGASLAFTDPANKDAQSLHFYSIIDGNRESSMPRRQRRRTDSNSSFRPTIIGVVEKGDLSFDFHRLPASAISKLGNRKGGYIELIGEGRGVPPALRRSGTPWDGEGRQ